jgi:hypothetical protein
MGTASVPVHLPPAWHLRVRLASYWNPARSHEDGVVVPLDLGVATAYLILITT